MDTYDHRLHLFYTDQFVGQCESVHTVLQFYFILAVRFEGNSTGWVIDDHCHFPQFVIYIVITRLKGI
jgi:hypothetical protein